jgi:hypothetical protein
MTARLSAGLETEMESSVELAMERKLLREGMPYAALRLELKLGWNQSVIQVA